MNTLKRNIVDKAINSPFNACMFREQCRQTADELVQLKAQTPQQIAAPLVMSEYQLKSALEFLSAYDTNDDIEQKLIFKRLEAGTDADGEHAPAGLYCWLEEYPEEGALFLPETPKPEPR